MFRAKPPLAETYRGLHVLVTGHTGFKGSWLCLWLSELGAEVAGFSDHVPTEPSAFESFGAASLRRDFRGDIRDAAAVAAAVEAWRPELILHLAAQPIVRQAMRDPLETFSANILGTATVLEAARHEPSVRAVLVVTSDKVYANDDGGRSFDESDPLGGHEPYGVSKAAAELVTSVYRSDRFHRGAASSNVPAVATARAGNVVGGGDWAADRLIPDALRAIASGQPMVIRSPRSTRPWQHVLEPLGGYLLHAQALLLDPAAAPASLNFGPGDGAARTTGEVIARFLEAMAPWRTELVIDEDSTGSEAQTLQVSSARARETLGWRPAWDYVEAIERIAEWHKAHLAGNADLHELARRQLRAYCEASTVPQLARQASQTANPMTFAEPT